jgi:cytochrome b pre-mRNA-processing protein 3
MFDAAVREARKPYWYADLGVPDTLDGRFSVLSTIVALMSVRIERGEGALGEAGPALTERFVETMDAEHRQIGLGDPTLGKVVRKMVGALGRRIGIVRSAVERSKSWEEVAQECLQPGESSDDQARAEALTQLWARLEATPDQALLEGEIR